MTEQTQNRVRLALLGALLVVAFVWYSWSAPGEKTPPAPRQALATAATVQKSSAAIELRPSAQPSAALRSRVERIAATPPYEEGIQRLRWDCASGGRDCKLTGELAGEEALAGFLRDLKEAPLQGQEVRPQVTLEHSGAGAEGRLAFELSLKGP